MHYSGAEKSIIFSINLVTLMALWGKTRKVSYNSLKSFYMLLNCTVWSHFLRFFMYRVVRQWCGTQRVKTIRNPLRLILWQNSGIYSLNPIYFSGNWWVSNDGSRKAESLTVHTVHTCDTTNCSFCEIIWFQSSLNLMYTVSDVQPENCQKTLRHHWQTSLYLLFHFF